jgi:hypothetical protein
MSVVRSHEAFGCAGDHFMHTFRPVAIAFCRPSDVNATASPVPPGIRPLTGPLCASHVRRLRLLLPVFPGSAPLVSDGAWGSFRACDARLPLPTSRAVCAIETDAVWP